MRMKIATIENTPAGLAEIARLKDESKRNSKYGPMKYGIRIYGRCHDKVAAFAATGRPHRPGSNSNSIYSLKSPEAKFCYAWAVYLESSVKQKIEIKCNHVAVPTKWGFNNCKICGKYIETSQAYPDGNSEIPGERY
jgi:hypothetical protein